MKTILIDNEQWAEETFKCEVEKCHKINFTNRFYDLSSALKYIKNNSVDLIFIDAESSEAKLNEFYQEVEKINPGIGIVFMTVNEELKETYNNYNVIVKPYNSEDIENILKEVNL